MKYILIVIILCINSISYCQNSEKNKKLKYELAINDSIYFVCKDSIYDYKEWPFNSKDGSHFPFWVTKLIRTKISNNISDTCYVFGCSYQKDRQNSDLKWLYIYHYPLDNGIITIHNLNWDIITQFEYGDKTKDSLIKKDIGYYKLVSKESNNIFFVENFKGYKQEKRFLTSSYKKHSNTFFSGMKEDFREKSIYNFFIKNFNH